jgi:hypothetical protein
LPHRDVAPPSATRQRAQFLLCCTALLWNCGRKSPCGRNPCERSSTRGVPPLNPHLESRLYFSDVFQPSVALRPSPFSVAAHLQKQESPDSCTRVRGGKSSAESLDTQPELVPS